MIQIENGGHKFNVLMGYKLKYPDLIKLILETESMDNEEKQYWFDLLPAMTEEQIDRLFDILENERKKLEALETNYQEEIKSINEKHIKEWEEMTGKKAECVTLRELESRIAKN